VSDEESKARGVWEDRGVSRVSCSGVKMKRNVALCGVVVVVAFRARRAVDSNKVCAVEY
jgi:hypothetical protein